jgi:hypothetical protein
MLRLELRLQGHPRIAKQIEAHIPNKTAKQIRDKRREATYRRLLQKKASALLPGVEGQPAIPSLPTVSEDPSTPTVAGRMGHTSPTMVRPCDLETDEPLSQRPRLEYTTTLDDATIIEDMRTDFKTRILEDLLAVDNVHLPLPRVRIDDIAILHLSSPPFQGERTIFNTGHY